MSIQLIDKKRKVARYERKDMFRLADFMRAEYTKSGMNNVDFAKYAGEKLGMPLLNIDHISNMCNDLGIPGNHRRSKGGDACDGTAMARLAKMEEEVKVLRARVDLLTNSYMAERKS